MKKFIYLFVLMTGFQLYSFDTAAQSDSVKTAVIKVGNITCKGDMPTIKKQLLNQEGIDEVSFTDMADQSSTFTILYHSSVTGKKQIEKIIETTPGCDDKSSTPYRVKKDKKQKPENP